MDNDADVPFPKPVTPVFSLRRCHRCHATFRPTGGRALYCGECRAARAVMPRREREDAA